VPVAVTLFAHIGVIIAEAKKPLTSREEAKENNMASPKTDAEARYAKVQKRAAEATLAVKEADAESRRVTDNTARLKGLRLAKIAAEAAELAANPPPPKRKAKARAKVAKAIPVEELNAEDDG
jgi:hypothetical protein